MMDGWILASLTVGVLQPGARQPHMHFLSQAELHNTIVAVCRDDIRRISSHLRTPSVVLRESHNKIKIADMRICTTGFILTHPHFHAVEDFSFIWAF